MEFPVGKEEVGQLWHPELRYHSTKDSCSLFRLSPRQYNLRNLQSLTLISEIQSFWDMTPWSLVNTGSYRHRGEGFPPPFTGYMQSGNRTFLIMNNSSILVRRHRHILSFPYVYFRPAFLLGLKRSSSQEISKLSSSALR
jgi:hypothetical protein